MKMQTKKNITRMLVICLAAVFLIYGGQRGEIAIVLNKAVNICLECIGLG